MTEKYDLAEYLCNLLSLMDSREDAGRPRGATLARAYERGYAQLREIIDQEEKELETRKNHDDSGKPEGRAEEPGYQPGRSGATGRTRWYPTGGGTHARRSGVESPDGGDDTTS